VYGAKISKDTVSRITEKVTGEMTEWLNRPLEKVYPVIFIDAMVVKVRHAQVVNKPVYVVIGVTVDGERDILGLWAGDGGEGAKFWLGVFTAIKNRGVQDVCIAVCHGLKGLPEAITTTWELATVQACVIHLIRNTFRVASRKYWEETSRDPAAMGRLVQPPTTSTPTDCAGSLAERMRASPPCASRAEVSLRAALGQSARTSRDQITRPEPMEPRHRPFTARSKLGGPRPRRPRVATLFSSSAWHRTAPRTTGHAVWG
jgi:hypothetical protein